MKESIIFQKSVAILIASIMLISPVSVQVALSLPGNQHASEMASIFSPTTAEALFPMAKEFSRIIDATDERIFKVSPGKHRIYGHWGFSGSIPFEVEGPLKDYLDKQFPDSASRQREKIRIVEIWRNDNARMVNLVERWTGLPTRKAKSVAAIMYDIHLLGDYTTSELSSLQKFAVIEDDLIKNMEAFCGKESAIELQARLKQIKATHKTDLTSRSREIRRVMAQNSHLEAKLPKTVRSYLVIDQTMNRWSSLNGRIPRRFQTTATAGAVAAIFSSIPNGFKVFNGEISLGEALLNVGKDTGNAVISLTVSDAIVTRVGNKIGIQAAIGSGTGLASAGGAALNAGVATFIFDEGQVVWDFAAGNITQEEFFKQTGYAVLKSGGSAATAYGTVAIGFSAGGPAFMVVTIGSYVLISYGIEKFEQFQANKYVGIDEVLGHLPFGIREKSPILGHGPAGLFANPLNIPGHLPEGLADNMDVLGHSPIPSASANQPLGHVPEGMNFDGDIPGHLPQPSY